LVRGSCVISPAIENWTRTWEREGVGSLDLGVVGGGGWERWIVGGVPPASEPGG
jgi:hypothetical protein